MRHHAEHGMSTLLLEGHHVSRNVPCLWAEVIIIVGHYCWSTSKYRNLCVRHAFFEGKKAKETFPRKVLLEH